MTGGPSGRSGLVKVASAWTLVVCATLAACTSDTQRSGDEWQFREPADADRIADVGKNGDTHPSAEDASTEDVPAVDDAAPVCSSEMCAADEECRPCMAGQGETGITCVPRATPGRCWDDGQCGPGGECRQATYCDQCGGCAIRDRPGFCVGDGSCRTLCEQLVECMLVDPDYCPEATPAERESLVDQCQPWCETSPLDLHDAIVGHPFCFETIEWYAATQPEFADACGI